MGLVDFDTERADRVLGVKRDANSPVAEAYAKTKVYKSLEDAGADLQDASAPQWVVLMVKLMTASSLTGFHPLLEDRPSRATITKFGC